MSIKNIVFDMGNVLLEWDSEKILSSIEGNTVRKNVLKEAVFESGLWERLDDGSLEIEELEKLLVHQLDSSYAESIHKLLWHWYECIEIYEEVQQNARRLSQKGYHLYILSNTSKLFYTLQEEGKLPITENVEGIVLSFEENTMKPEKVIYQTLLERYQLEANETIFLDDMEANIIAAQQCGIHTYRVNNITELQQQLEKWIKGGIGNGDY